MSGAEDACNISGDHDRVLTKPPLDIVAQPRLFRAAIKQRFAKIINSAFNLITLCRCKGHKVMIFAPMFQFYGQVPVKQSFLNVKVLVGTFNQGFLHDCEIFVNLRLSFVTLLATEPALTETLGDVVDLVDIRVPGKYRVPGQHFRVQTADGPDVNLEIKTLTSRLFN